MRGVRGIRSPGPFTGRSCETFATLFARSNPVPMGFKQCSMHISCLLYLKLDKVFDLLHGAGLCEPLFELSADHGLHVQL